MAEHTREAVRAAIVKSFGSDSVSQIFSKLDEYGTKPQESERERVQLAILNLSRGDLARLDHFLEQAKLEYRDVLLWSEYPEVSRQDTMICHNCGTIAHDGTRFCSKCGSAFPPPLPGTFDSTVGLRSAVALVFGALAYFVSLHRFLSYSQRNRLGAADYITFALLVFVVGFATTLNVRKSRYRIASWTIAGVWALHAFVIAMDLREDPTNHNLLPFEFIILGFVALPVYIGAALSSVASRLMNKT
jgi:hypothetical protein